MAYFRCGAAGGDLDSAVSPAPAPAAGQGLAPCGRFPPDHWLAIRSARGKRSDRRGRQAEAIAKALLQTRGWTILGERIRTGAGEVDIAAERDGTLSVVEVKARNTLAEAAASMSRRQQIRVWQAGEILLGEHPEWGRNGAQVDLIVIDAAGRAEHIEDAVRLG
jgi:putative endonuclease